MNEEGFARIMSAGYSRSCSLSSGRVHPWKLYISKYFGPPTGMGGLIVDGRGKWIIGFMGHTSANFFSLNAELQALFIGLVALNNLGYKKSEVYLSKAARDAMKLSEFDDKKYAKSILYSKICSRWEISECDHGPDFPSAYAKLAEWLAKRAVLDDIELAVLQVPPIEIRNFFDNEPEVLEVPYIEIRNLFDI